MKDSIKIIIVNFDIVLKFKFRVSIHDLETNMFPDLLS